MLLERWRVEPVAAIRLGGALDAIAVLGAQNEELRADNAALRTRVAHLEAELRKDSTTSSAPPSRDPIETRKKRAGRRADARAEKRAQDKQPGAPGAHLKRREPGTVIGHNPVCCGSCGADLADAPVVGEVVRQVIDLPPVTPTVTDHVAYRASHS